MSRSTIIQPSKNCRRLTLMRCLQWRISGSTPIPVWIRSQRPERWSTISAQAPMWRAEARSPSSWRKIELYVNSIFYGNGYYCVGDAAMGYFGKSPSEMNFDECTLLAGIPNAPSNYNPVASPKLARERQAQVIEKMIRAGYLDRDYLE